MDSNCSSVIEAVKNKDYPKLKSILEQSEDSDQRFYDRLFEIYGRLETDSEAVETYLNNDKIDINRRNSTGEAILHVLSRSGSFDWVQRIIEKHENVLVDAKCVKRKTPLLVAAEHGHLDILKLLEKNGADINHCDSAADGALHWAATKGHVNCVKYLIEEKGNDVDVKNKYGDTPLSRAANFGHDKCLEYLLNKGANIFETDLDGESTLLKTAVCGHVKCTEILLQRSLIDANYDAVARYINMQDKNGNTALSWAATLGFGDIVTQLLRYEANVDLQDAWGKTALNWASGKGHGDIVTQLLKARASVDVLDKEKKTALIWAASMGQTESVRHLLNANAKIDIQDKQGNTALMWAASKGQYYYPYTQIKQAVNWTPGTGHDSIVALLVQANADVNIQSSDGQTALIWAARRGSLDPSRKLIEAKADVNLTDNLGETPLMKAARYGNEEIVRLLVEAGAAVHLRNRRNQRAFDLAKKANIWKLLG